MTSRETIPVFVNGARLAVPRGATVLDAVRASDATLAQQMESGALVATDSRGLPLSGDAPLAAGAIVRLVSPRTRVAEAAPGAGG